jgi:LysE type translocator
MRRVSWYGLVSFCAVYFLAVATPGPGVAAVIARGLARGPQGAAAFIAGFVVGDLIWFLGAALGLSALAQTAHSAFVAVKYAGAAYLLFLAYRLWSAPMGYIEIAAAITVILPAILGAYVLAAARRAVSYTRRPPAHSPLTAAVARKSAGMDAEKESPAAGGFEPPAAGEFPDQRRSSLITAPVTGLMMKLSMCRSSSNMLSNDPVTTSKDCF